MGCETQEDERTERGKTCTGASTAARQAREDTASLTLEVARNECGRGATARIHGRSQSSEDALMHDPSRVCGDVGIRRTYLRRARGREPEPAGGRTVTRDVGLHNSVRQDRVRECLPPPEAAIERRRYFTTSLAETATAADDPAGDHEHAVAGVVQRFRVFWRWRPVCPHDLENEEVVSIDQRIVVQATFEIGVTLADQRRVHRAPLLTASLPDGRRSLT